MEECLYKHLSFDDGERPCPSMTLQVSFHRRSWRIACYKQFSSLGGNGNRHTLSANRTWRMPYKHFSFDDGERPCPSMTLQSQFHRRSWIIRFVLAQTYFEEWSEKDHHLKKVHAYFCWRLRWRTIFLRKEVTSSLVRDPVYLQLSGMPILSSDRESTLSFHPFWPWANDCRIWCFL